ncbi:hypothetical protein C0389_06540 [bacterium]|nr:hypothetical protein [bacterium]
MKRTAIFFAVVLFTIVLFNSNANAQTTGNGRGAKVNWVDANGDGICDNVGTSLQGVNRTGKGYGKKDGTGNPLRPQDGTGFGAKGGNLTGTGVCDGSGPKGSMGRRGGK